MIIKRPRESERRGAFATLISHLSTIRRAVAGWQTAVALYRHEHLEKRSVSQPGVFLGVVSAYAFQFILDRDTGS